MIAKGGRDSWWRPLRSHERAPRHGGQPWAAGAIALLVLTGLATLLWRQVDARDGTGDHLLTVAVLCQIGAGFVFLALVVWLLRAPNAVSLGLVVVVGLALRLAAAPAAPGHEDDFHRYLWDGAVLSQGFNPYRYSPAEVARGWTDEGRVPAELVALGRQAGETLSRINHLDLRSIYPPFATLQFALAHRLAPWSLDGWRVVILFNDLAALGLLLGLLGALRLPATAVGIYWLNPLVATELYQGAHMDGLLLPWIVAAVWAALRGRTVLAAVALALAVALKLWPILLLPLVLRAAWPSRKRVLAALLVHVAIVTALLLPLHVQGATAPSGLAFYAQYWRNNSALFALQHQFWETLLPWLGVAGELAGSITRWVTVALLGALIALLTLRGRRDASDLPLHCLWVVAGLFLLSPTQFPWYFLWLVPLLVLQPSLPLLLYSALLPLYHLDVDAPWSAWLQHGPVLLLLGLGITCRITRCRVPRWLSGPVMTSRLGQPERAGP